MEYVITLLGTAFLLSTAPVPVSSIETIVTFPTLEACTDYAEMASTNETFTEIYTIVEPVCEPKETVVE